MESLVKENITEGIGLCRPLIREPQLIKRWLQGDWRKAKCTSCNQCLTELFLRGKPLACYLDRRETY